MISSANYRLHSFECNETAYWLELLHRSDTISTEIAQKLLKKCTRIRFMLIKSLNTAKIPES